VLRPDWAGNATRFFPTLCQKLGPAILLQCPLDSCRLLRGIEDLHRIFADGNGYSFIIPTEQISP
jgi:hypothetical protein